MRTRDAARPFQSLRDNDRFHLFEKHLFDARTAYARIERDAHVPRDWKAPFILVLNSHFDAPQCAVELRI